MACQDARGCAQLIRGMQVRVGGEDLLADVRVPALVVAGAQDTYLDPKTLRAVANADMYTTLVGAPVGAGIAVSAPKTVVAALWESSTSSRS